MVRPINILGKVRDDSPFSRAAVAYGVTVLRGDVTKRIRDTARDGWFFGPQGGAYSPGRRAVLLAREQLWWGGTEDEAKIFHELAHLITAVPFFRHERVPEEFLLLPWEEMAAKSFGIWSEGYESYRATTRLKTFGDKRISEMKRDFSASSSWQEARRRCNQLGMSTPNSISIGHWPNWSALTRQDIDKLLSFESKGWA